MPTPKLAASLARETTALAVCWRIVRADGVALGFTTHDKPLAFGGVVHRPAPGLRPSAIESSGDDRGHAMEVAGALSDAALSEADLLTGRYDGSQVTTLIVDWETPAEGALVMAAGRLGDLGARDGEFTADLRTPAADLQLMPIELYSPECRARLGDPRCRVDLARHTMLVEAGLSSNGQRIAIGSTAGTGEALRDGRVRVVTGAAAGAERAIAGSDAGAILVDEPIDGLIAGDRLEVRAGCDKRFATCRDRFQNALNFRGEPHVPGADALFRYAGL